MVTSHYMDPVEVANWRELELHPFCECLPDMTPEEFEELRCSIIGMGLLLPIVIYDGKILDGRHRWRVCVQENIEPHFELWVGPGTPYDYVLEINLHRRNLTVPQKIEAASKLVDTYREWAREKQSAAGGDKKSLEAPVPQAVNNVISLDAVRAPQVRDKIAEAVGASPRTVQDALTIRNKGEPEDWQEVLDGKASIKAKAKEVRSREIEEPIKSRVITLKEWKELSEAERLEALATDGHKALNRQSTESIGWAKWSWNPITGCLHNCPYCYARDIAKRFYEHGFEPALIPDRLTAPQNQKARLSGDPAERNIFTGSMSDIFGKWVPEEWIDAVMQSVARSPEFNFLFLTKFPLRMVDRQVPRNVWLGTSVDSQARVKAVEDAFAKVPAHTRWLSVEPLIEPLTFTRPELFQWVVIGGASASTQTPAWQPPFAWVADLYQTFTRAGARVYIKDNVGFDGPRRPRGFPWTDDQPESAPPEFARR